MAADGKPARSGADTDVEHDDLVWRSVSREAEDVVAREPLLASKLHATILSHVCLEDALAYHLASKLATNDMREVLLRDIISGVFTESDDIGPALRADLVAFRDRDPASDGVLTPLMYYKGYHALESYRVAHHLWGQGRRELAYFFQNRISEVFAVDIHPAAQIGLGIFVDHGTGIVIGETAVVGDNVSMLQDVTLGGTGRETGDRHPNIGSHVLIGAGAKILGNITVGAQAKVGAGSVVLDDVPPCTTVAGIPARVVGHCEQDMPAIGMDHGLPSFDDE